MNKIFTLLTGLTLVLGGFMFANNGFAQNSNANANASNASVVGSVTVSNAHVGKLSNKQKDKVGKGASMIATLLIKNGQLDTQQYELLIELLDEYITKFEKNGDEQKLALAITVKDVINIHLRNEGYMDDDSDDDGLMDGKEKTIMVAGHTEACPEAEEETCLLVKELDDDDRDDDDDDDDRDDDDDDDDSDDDDDDDRDDDDDDDSDDDDDDRDDDDDDDSDDDDDDDRDDDDDDDRDDDDDDDSDDDDWTHFYGNIKGFNYEEGYTYTLVIEKTTTADTDTSDDDASTVSWSLVKIVDIEAEMPENCSVWYDGCNTCMVGNDGTLACTEMACTEAEKPYCMEFENGETQEAPEDPYVGSKNSSRSKG